MTDFQELSSFIQVVKAGGFMQASRQFGTPKSTLSRHVLTLEQRLGATLLHRSTRKIKLSLLFAPRAEFLTWNLSNNKINVNVTPVPKFKITNLAMCIELVKQGLGISLVPAFMLRDSIITGELELVLPEWKTEHRPMSLIWPQQSEPPRRVRLFIEYLTRELAQK